MKTAQHLLATLAAVIACLLPFPAQAETIEETRAKAEKGDAEAQCNLGKRYNKGEGIEMNKTEAVKWSARLPSKEMLPHSDSSD